MDHYIDIPYPKQVKNGDPNGLRPFISVFRRVAYVIDLGVGGVEGCPKSDGWN